MLVYNLFQPVALPFNDIGEPQTVKSVNILAPTYRTDALSAFTRRTLAAHGRDYISVAKTPQNEQQSAPAALMTFETACMLVKSFPFDGQKSFLQSWVERATALRVLKDVGTNQPLSELHFSADDAAISLEDAVGICATYLLNYVIERPTSAAPKIIALQ